MSRQEDAFSGCLATRLGMMSFPPPHTHTQYSSTLGHAWSRASTRVSGHAEPHVRGGGAAQCACAELGELGLLQLMTLHFLSLPGWGKRSKCWSQAGPGSSGLPCIDVTCQLVNRIPPNEGRAGV